MTLLADLLHLFKYIIVDNARVGIGENRLLFNGIIPLFLIPDRIGVSLEVHRAACVLPAFQNPDNCAVTPAIRVLRFLIGAFDPLQGFVGSRCQYFVRFQLVCNLLWTSALHAHGENTPHHIGGNRVDLPASGIVWAFQIAVGNIGCQRNAAFTLCLIDSADLAAGISRVKLVAPVFDTRKIVIGAVGINGVEIVVDGNIADTVLRKGEIGVKSCQSGISTQAG